MPLETAIITDSNIADAPWTDESENGVIGQENWRVSTHDQGRARRAVRPIGDPWGSDEPGLVVVRKRTRYWFGKDRQSSGGDLPTGGYTIVQVDFATPGTSGRLPPPDPGLRFTKLETSDETITVFAGVLDNQSEAEAINNGEGAPKLVGVTKARIYTYWRLNQPPPWGRLLILTRDKVVNNAPIVIPPIYGTPTTFNMEEHQVRFEGYEEPQVKNGLLEMVFVVSLAKDFMFRWNQQATDYMYTDVVRERQLYVYGDIGGLW